MLGLNSKKLNSPQMLFLYFTPLIVGIAFFISSNSFLRDLSVIEGGLNICELRVLQSYTTFVKYDRQGQGNSNYLSSRFMDETENCFAEVLAKVESTGLIFSTMSKDVLNQLNQVQNNVHWFHSSIKREKSLLAHNSSSGIGSKFSEVENKKNSISSLLSAQREKVYNLTKLIGLPMVLMALVLAFSIFFFLKSIFEYRKNIKGLEEKAQNLIYNGENWNAQELQDLVTKALHLSDLKSLAEVARRWSKYTVQMTPEKEQRILTANSSTVEEAKIELQTENPAIDDDFIDYETKQVIEQQTNAPEVFKNEQLALDLSVTRIVEVLASKIFTYGINFQILVDEGITFEANDDFKEYLDQIILSFLGPLVGVVGGNKEQNKKITLTTTKRMDSERGHGVVDLVMAPTPSVQILEEEFVIPITLLKEIGGSVKIQTNGTIWLELPLKINFQNTEIVENTTKSKSEQKLVHLFRGKKKDLLKQI